MSGPEDCEQAADRCHQSRAFRKDCDPATQVPRTDGNPDGEGWLQPPWSTLPSLFSLFGSMEPVEKSLGIGQWLTHARAGEPSFLGLIGFASFSIAAVARDNVWELAVVMTLKTCTRAFAVSET